MDGEEEEEIKRCLFSVPQPLQFFLAKFISFQSHVIRTLLSFLLSPVFFLLSAGSLSFRQAAQVQHAVAGCSTRLARRTGAGLSGAANAAGILAALVVPAAAVGLGLVGLWAEEPLFLRESLEFDYSATNPNAVLRFSGARGGAKKGVPVGHTVSVSVILLMPDSDYNREVGVFQLTAELLSKDGDTIAKASKPCMMRYRSLPIRLTRTLLMGIPLLLGLTGETQTVTVGILLKHKEGMPRTAAIKITIIARAKTSYVPQLYEAEIVIKSQLPWGKHLVRKWKWTFYVWTSLYVYITLLVLLLCCYKSLFFPVTMANQYDEHHGEDKLNDEPQLRIREGEVSELLRRWRQSKRKRREFLNVGSSSLASSTAIASGEDGRVVGKMSGVRN